jgi:hypothetical protein
MVLKQYNSAPASRIRPQIFSTCGHFFQSRTSLGNPTIFSSKIQASACKDKGYHENSSGAKGEGKKVEGKLTSQHFIGGFDDAKNKRIAFFVMQKFCRQAGHFITKNRYLLR